VILTEVPQPYSVLNWDHGFVMPVSVCISCQLSIYSISVMLQTNRNWSRNLPVCGAVFSFTYHNVYHFTCTYQKVPDSSNIHRSHAEFWFLSMDPPLCHSSGTLHLEVAPVYLENLWTLVQCSSNITGFQNDLFIFFCIYVCLSIRQKTKSKS
jgi:hypothetical protein